MRLLHLIDPPLPDSGLTPRPRIRRASRAGDTAAIVCKAITENLPDCRHTVCIIGSTDDERRLSELGLDSTDRISPPTRVTLHAGRGLRALSRDRFGPGGPDAVLSYSVASLGLASLSYRRRTRHVCVLTHPPLIPRPSWSLMDRSAGFVVLADADADAWVEYGVPTDRITVAPPPPPVPRVTLDAGYRAELRAALGLEEDDVAVAVLGDPPAAVDAVWAWYVLNTIETNGTPVVGIIPSGASQIARAQRLGRTGSSKQRLIVADSPMISLIGACDVAFWDSTIHPGTESHGQSGGAAVLIGAAHAAGVPVVITRQAAPSGLYDESTAKQCLAFNGTFPEMARKLLPLVRDADRRADVSRRVSRVSVGDTDGLCRVILDACEANAPVGAARSIERFRWRWSVQSMGATG